MKYTFFCELGRMYKPGLHYLFIGGWIKPSPARFVVLSHGNMTSTEYARIIKTGQCPICFEAHYHMLRIYQQPIEWHSAKYHENHFQNCGTMKQSGRYHNLYIGQIDVNKIKGCL